MPGPRGSVLLIGCGAVGIACALFAARAAPTSHANSRPRAAAFGHPGFCLLSLCSSLLSTSFVLSPCLPPCLPASLPLCYSIRRFPLICVVRSTCIISSHNTARARTHALTSARPPVNSSFCHELTLHPQRMPGAAGARPKRGGQPKLPALSAHAGRRECGW